MSRRVEDLSPSKHASVPLRGSKSTLTNHRNEEQVGETEVCFMIEIGEPVEYPKDYFDLVKQKLFKLPKDYNESQVFSEDEVREAVNSLLHDAVN